MTPEDALKNIQTLVDQSAALKDNMLRKVLLRSVIVVAQKGLGIEVEFEGEKAASPDDPVISAITP